MPELSALRRPKFVFGLLLVVGALLLAIALPRLVGWPLDVRSTPTARGAVLELQVRLGAAAADGVAESGGTDAGVSDAGVSDAEAARPPAALSPGSVQDVNVRVVYRTENDTYVQVGAGVTDGQGHLQLSGLPEGDVWVIAQGLRTARTSRPLRLVARQRVELELYPARTLQVRVSDDQGDPVTDATVLVDNVLEALSPRQDESSSAPEQLPFGALTNPEGSAAFEHLRHAAHRVRVYARGYEAFERFNVRADLDVVLRRLGGLSIDVVDGESKPVQDAEVYVVGSSLWPARKLQTNEQGHADLNGLLSGVYDLRARKGNLVSRVEGAVRLERGERRKLRLQLAPGRWVRVKVKGAAPQSEPIEGAAVVLAEFGLSPFPISARTNASGKASLGPLTEGTAYVSVRASGYVGRGAVPVPADLKDELEVVLLRGATLKGRVEDEFGHAIAGARVEVVGIDLDGLPIDETPLLAAYRDAHFDFAMKPMPLMPAGELGVTLGHVPYVNETHAASGWTELPEDYRPWISDVEGRFRAHPVPPGRVKVLVRHPTYVEAESDLVELGPGGEAEVRVVMQSGGRLLGRVVDHRGRPVAAARVRVLSIAGSFEETVVSASDGMFRLSAVPDRVVVLLARPDEPMRFVWRQEIEVSAGSDRELEFELPEPRGNIRWRVVDERDQPIDLAQLTLLSLDPQLPIRVTRFTDSDGYVEVEDVEGAKLRVALRAPGYVPMSEELRAIPAERTITLARGINVVGRITAARGHVDVSGARVTLLTGATGGRAQTTTSDKYGEYQFSQVAPGPISLRVQHDDYAVREVSTKVQDTGHAERAFELEAIELEAGATLRGLVVDEEGVPVPRARVGLGRQPTYLVRGSLPQGSVLTDEEGRFELRSVRPGNVEIGAISALRGRGELMVAVEEDDELEDLEVQLAPYDEMAGSGISGLAVTLGERDLANGVAVVIVSVGAGSEAERGGLLPGDVVRAVDGQPVADMGEARQRSNGKAGTDVVIQVNRDGEPQSFRVRREPLSP